MGEFSEILVTPEILKRSAKVMEEALQQAIMGYREIGETVSGLESCFQGKSADRMRKRIGKKKEKGIEMIEEMMYFPDRLIEIAEEYEKAEKENKDAANRN